MHRAQLLLVVFLLNPEAVDGRLYVPRCYSFLLEHLTSSIWFRPSGCISIVLSVICTASGCRADSLRTFKWWFMLLLSLVEEFARFIYFFVPWFVLIICCFRRVATAYSKRPWRSHSRLLWLGMLPVVIRSRFSGPSGALVKQRWVNFSLFTLCVSSPVFRVTSGSGRFYGWQFDSRHDSDSPAEAKARRDSVLLSDKTFLQIHELLFGFESRLLASPRWWFNRDGVSLSSSEKCSCDVPHLPRLPRRAHFLLFIITLITRISAPKRFSLTSKPFKRVCRPSQSGCDYRQRRRREFNWMSQVISSPRCAKGQVFCFVLLLLFFSS